MKEDVVYYKKNNLTPIISVNAIYTIHYFKYSKNFRFKGEKHDFWEIVYIDSGKATIVAGENEYQLIQGECFLHKPNEPHTIYTTDDFANSVIITFENDNKDLFDLCSSKHILNDNQKILLNRIIFEAKHSFSDQLDELYLSKMNRNDKSPYGSDQIIKNCIELLLISLIRNKDDKVNTFSSIKSINHGKIVETIISILQDKIEEGKSVNLDEISFTLKYSKSYLKMKFKEKTGYSIIQYFINMKIDKAKELLSQQRYTVSEISDMLGFASLFYFSRQFKQCTSMSPTEYISSIKEDNTL